MRIRDKQDIDLLEVASHYTSMTSAGSGEYKGLCPLPEHDDHNPSFFVNKEKGVWLCRGCDMGGDVFDLVSDIEGVDFLGSMRKLQELFDYDFSLFRKTWSSDNADSGIDFAILAETAKLYNQFLTRGEGLSNIYKAEHEKAKQYLDQRGVDLGQINYWKLGFAPSQPCALVEALGKAGFESKDIYKCGLSKRSQESAFDGYRDFFVARVMIPVSDRHGRVIGFAGRDLYDRSSAKYLNSPDGIFFQKSKALLGINRVKKNSDRVVIVEGPFDVIRMVQLGWTTVAALGTAFRTSHIELLESIGVKRIDLLFDGDAAGEKATERTAELLLSHDISCYISRLDEGIDPDIAGRTKEGQETIRQQLDRTDTTDFVRYFIEQREPKDPQQKLEVLQVLQAKLQTVPKSQELKVQLLLKEALGLLGLEDLQISLKTRRIIKEPAVTMSQIEEDIVWAVLHAHEHPAVAQMIWELSPKRYLLSQVGLILFNAVQRMHLEELSLEKILPDEDLRGIIIQLKESPKQHNTESLERLLANVIRWLSFREIGQAVHRLEEGSSRGLIQYAEATRIRLER